MADRVPGLSEVSNCAPFHRINCVTVVFYFFPVNSSQKTLLEVAWLQLTHRTAQTKFVTIRRVLYRTGTLSNKNRKKKWIENTLGS